jgi:hypothetical protein
MPNSLAPVIHNGYTQTTILLATSQYFEEYNAQPPLQATLGGGSTRPSTGQVYPRGDR